MTIFTTTICQEQTKPRKSSPSTTPSASVYNPRTKDTAGYVLLVVYIPSQQPNLGEIHSLLDIIANIGFHPIFNKNYCTYKNDDPHNELTWYELSPEKIHVLKSAAKIATFEILSTLKVISMNIVPPEVKTFVILCNPKDHKYNSRTLYEVVNCKLNSRTLDKADSRHLEPKIEQISNKNAYEELSSLVYISTFKLIFTG